MALAASRTFVLFLVKCQSLHPGVCEGLLSSQTSISINLHKVHRVGRSASNLHLASAREYHLPTIAFCKRLMQLCSLSLLLRLHHLIAFAAEAEADCHAHSNKPTIQKSNSNLYTVRRVPKLTVSSLATTSFASALMFSQMGSSAS
eukprot:GHRR01033538.1.p1 GENE.GHRR01033538.1~~GHRR01033538.1.p1  ORF type:complete len:146 (+),score=27.36 GHRR01033538.1:175-612(+)